LSLRNHRLKETRTIPRIVNSRARHVDINATIPFAGIPRQCITPNRREKKPVRISPLKLGGLVCKAAKILNDPLIKRKEVASRTSLWGLLCNSNRIMIPVTRSTMARFV
jgi:hypothetical protein